MNSNWKALNKIDDPRLFEARGQLHQAVQLLAAAGISYIPHRADDSHTAMLWSTEKFQFQSQLFNEHFQLALDPANLTISIYKSGDPIHALDLNGMTLTEASGKVQNILESQGVPKNAFSMKKALRAT